MNFEFLRSKIKEKFRSMEAFAESIEVSRVTVSNWLSETQKPEEYRFLDIINSLDLSEDEVDELFNNPKISVLFRKVGGTSTEASIKARSEDLANTFFKIDGSGYTTKESLLPIKTPQNPIDVANHIRKNILCLEKNEPVILSEALSELKKYNINVFFVPFQKIGITLSSSQNSHKEVAFTAIKGEKIIIFVDTNRTKDEANFDICHELAHIVLDHKNTNEEEEKFCNKIAQELVYPSSFILENKIEIEKFSNAKKFSWYDAVTQFNNFFAVFDWSPKGLAIALKEKELIENNSHEYRRLMKMHSSGHSRINIDDLFFKFFNPQDFNKIKIFFKETIFKDKDLFKPFIELKDAATSGRLSPRKLGEILNMDSGDADELIRAWEAELGTEDCQDDRSEPV